MVLNLTTDLVEAVQIPVNLYTELQSCLLAAHQLTDIQLVEQLPAAVAGQSEAVNRSYLSRCIRARAGLHIGKASTHLVDLSMAVNRYTWPSEEAARGPTMQVMDEDIIP